MIDRDCTVKARAFEQQLTESSQKGTPGIQINFCVTDGEFKDQTIRFDGWFSETVIKEGKNVGRTVAELVIDNLLTLGWEGEDIGEFGDRKLHGLDKNEVELVIGLDPYEGDDEKYVGRSFPRVRFINKVGGRGLNVEKAMAPEKASAFGDRMRNLVLKSKLAKGQPIQDTGTDFPHGANVEQPKATGTGGRKF